MVMKPQSLPQRERLQLVILLARDPGTNRFYMEAAVREDNGPLETGLRRDCSPTLFAATLHACAHEAVEDFLAQAADRWDAELGREIVDVDELASLRLRPRV